MKRNQKSGDSLSQLDSHIWPTVLTTCICCEMRYSSPPSTTVPNPISGTLHSSQKRFMYSLYPCPILGQQKSGTMLAFFRCHGL